MFPPIFMSSNNRTIDGNGFYISYNPRTDVGPETALVKKGSTTKFYILLGDYQKDYKKVFPQGYGACKKLYQQLIKDGAKKSPWSN